MVLSASIMLFRSLDLLVDPLLKFDAFWVEPLKNGNEPLRPRCEVVRVALEDLLALLDRPQGHALHLAIVLESRGRPFSCWAGRSD